MLLGLSITTIVLFYKHSDDYDFDIEADVIYGTMASICFYYSYRLVLFIWFYMFICVYCLCLLCCCKIIFKKAIPMTWKFLTGQLDIASACTCLSNEKKNSLQVIFDIIALIIDIVLFLSAIVFGIILSTFRKERGNPLPIFLYILQSVPLLIILFVNSVRS